MRFEKPVYVTTPLLPDLNKLNDLLIPIWQSKWLTNHGRMHAELEQRLESILKVKNVSIFNNGTIALLSALKALELPAGSEVITTPFTFPATPHCITWNHLTPFFCDIHPESMTINAEIIERHITRNTSAILGVHVYGIPCDVEKIQKIARRYNLKVIYDAAHCFTTEINGRGIGTFGDMSMFSFHATKLFHTLEGGCLTYNKSDYKEKVYYLRNFGIKNEDEVVEVGINGKMNELQAVIGILNLEIFEEEKQKRRAIKETYFEKLKSVSGIKIVQMPHGVSDSMGYFVIRIKHQTFGLSRDEVYDALKEYNVFSRKYFYPLCSEYEPYKALPSSSMDNLPIANRIKQEVLCLPLYGNLGIADAERICEIIKFIRRKSGVFVSPENKN